MASPLSTWMDQVRKNLKANDLNAFRMAVTITRNRQWNSGLTKTS